MCKSTQIARKNSRNSCGVWFLLYCIRLLVMERHAVQIIPSSILLFFVDNMSKIFPCCCMEFLCCWNCEIHCDISFSGFTSSPEIRRYLHEHKGKVHPTTGHEGPEGEWRYSSTLSLTLALDGGGWSMPHPGHFSPRKEIRYPSYRRLGGPHGQSGRVRKILTPPGFDPQTVLPVASRYMDYTIQAHNLT